MTRLLVAAGQAVPVNGDPAANVALAADLTRQAGVRGVRLLVLPEAFLTGYAARAGARQRDVRRRRGCSRHVR
ncbi:nitrilase-related carbon-nitrogen hydrolase [Nocardioides sp. REDSEA-S30_B4]|uniref:nitrilase-related carbon-nitrogen hydrolase n=1 Tax=Nocardioides sp. REDSEA-S30_B4 TaxID=1811552 RepID=UPI000B28AF57|nr:nitrilase-related carbon-nitrogen hydrolase [Nocardioides sp. REDSEA-S30_B4]